MRLIRLDDWWIRNWPPWTRRSSKKALKDLDWETELPIPPKTENWAIFALIAIGTMSGFLIHEPKMEVAESTFPLSI